MSGTVRLRLDLGYDGTDFRGWAKQPAHRTVQGVLESALDTVLRTAGTTVTVAGRTDTGVHARGQVCHVDLDPVLLARAAGRLEGTPAQALQRRLNGLLDPDVRVHRVTEALPGFDARFGALWRRYAYRIVDSAELVDPLLRHSVVTWPRPLDPGPMNEAAARLLGLHDFAAFCRRREGATTIRSLLALEWTRVDGVLVAEVRADAFCHSMVRSLVGCLAAVGEGRERPSWATEVLTGAVRPPSLTVAPAHGLTLEEVAYPDAAGLAEQAAQSRAVRTLGAGAQAPPR